MNAGDNPSPASWSDLLRSRHFGQVVLVCFGIWLHAADELMVSTISPAMVSDIGGERYVAWLIVLYEVGSIVAGALAALLAISLGLQRAMAAAALIYGVGCAASALSGTMEHMLAARLVQGLGGGWMIATAFVAVHRNFPVALIARIFALMSLVWGVSAFSGPLVGGLFAEYGHWRSAFWFLAVQAVAYSALALTRLRDGEGHAQQELPAGGKIVLIALRICLLGAGVIAVASAGTEENAALALVRLASGLILIAAFLFLDGAAGSERLLPRRSWDVGAIQGAVLAMVLFLSACTTGLITYGPLLLSRLHGLDAVTIGLILMLESIGWSVVAVAVAGIRERYETRAILGGFLAVAVSIAGLYLTIPHGPVAAIAFFAAMQGAGFGAAWTFVVKRAVSLAPEDEKDRISSAIPTVQRLGYALGAAFVGIVANSTGFATAQDAAATMRSSDWIFALSLIPALIGIAAAIRFVRFLAR